MTADPAPPAGPVEPAGTGPAGTGLDGSTAPVVVVGGGIAGAACATELARVGVPVRLADRGRRWGGRLAVRTLRDTGTPYDGHAVDLGASYLTAHDPDFRALVDGWVDRGLARAWTDTFAVAGPEGLRGTTTGPLRYSAPHGLRSLVEAMVGDLPEEGVTLCPHHEVGAVRLGDDGLPRVDDEPAAAVALCMPDPQVRQLIEPGSPAFRSTRRATEGVLWEPVIALVAVYAKRCWPELDGVFVNDDPVVTWIADDGRRRGDGAAVLVAHADPVASARYLREPETIAPAMLASIRRVLGTTADPDWIEVKRWTYARPVTAWPEPFHLDPGTRVALAGDGWHAGPRVECAWLSGRDLGRALVDLVGGG